MSKVLNSLARLFVPEEIMKHFEIEEMEEISNCIYIKMVQKSDVDHIPKEIVREGKIKQNGYCNKIDIQPFPAQGKEVFIRLIRRKWSEKQREVGYGKSYSNNYEFTVEGTRATKEFGAFLKSICR